MHAMNDLNAFVERYVSVWNEADPEARRRRIRELWTDDGVQFTKTMEPRGYAELEARVIGSWEKSVRDGGYVFRSRGNAEGHHDMVRFHWEMLPAKGGPIAALGQELLLLDGNGKIRIDWMFVEPTPA
jgi:hypothetical protein